MAKRPAPLYTQKDRAREDAIVPRPSDGEDYRSPWRKDYGRLVHSPSFRRLQGKTQLFPGTDHDFFRNRLTHSIEVAQIAKGIAERLNYIHPPFRAARDRGDADGYISLDLVEFAGLAHDLGHPPFGHTGEYALDECMKVYGGFEGNAQTFRILARLEKKRTTNWPPTEFSATEDCRRGLNLTYRSLASILKYDAAIPLTRSGSDHLQKGYYKSERKLIREIKKSFSLPRHIPLKTLECSIMDIADDIAYSTYDFEDALKAGFISLLDLLNIESNRELIGRVTVKVWRAMEGRREPWVFGDDPAQWKMVLPNAWIDQLEETKESIVTCLRKLCVDLLPSEEANQASASLDGKPNASGRKSNATPEEIVSAITRACSISKNASISGYIRSDLTSQLVNESIGGTGIKYNPEIPALSECAISKKQRLKIETLKHLSFELHILSTRLKVVEYRGKEIVKALFDCLASQEGYMLLPDDWRSVAAFYKRRNDEAGRRRAICDYIAGMTDRYALELYARLTSEIPQTIFRVY